jgi:alpha-glucosidase
VVFIGGTPLDVVRALARRTGRTLMLPRWSLGYHQCRYSYGDESEVRSVARELRDRGFGCDAIYFDIHYMDGYRVFTWDRAAFPDPAGLIGELSADGFRSVVIIDPGVKCDDPDYAVAREGLEAGHFCTYPDGRPFVGDVWPGPCHFPDFTDPAARAWWGGLHAELVSQGVAGVWNDMNEPAVFTVPGEEAGAGTFPLEVRHQLEGSGGDHAEAHNVYGMQMSRATADGLRTLAPSRRPFVITRAAYAGTQRYATTWTGDNAATWDHLRLAVQQCLSLAASGMPFSGSDVGGFIGEPDGELFARWMQVGALTPLFRNHSAVDSPRREPWLFGEEVERVSREAVELRYRLLPYLYTALREAATAGTPILRALPLVHPSDETVRHSSPLGFYVGPDVLAHPVLEPGQLHREVYLPARDGGWTCFHTGAAFPGRSSIWTETPLDRLPLYVGAGCVLPLAPPRRNSDEPLERLTLRVYAGPATWQSSLYDDAGDGWEFQDGEFWHATFSAIDDGDELRLKCSVDGRRPPPAESWTIVLLGLGRPVESIAVDGVSAEFTTGNGGPVVETGPFEELVVRRVGSTARG